MILIFTEHITPRLIFVSKFIFTDILWSEVHFTSSIEEFSGFNGVKINYSSQKTVGFKIMPSGFLFETGVRNFQPDVGTDNEMPVLFPNDEPDFQFDIFSATFYLISRYEEYLPHETDKHGRFKATSSFAYRHSFHDKPMVDCWVYQLRYALEKKFPEYRFTDRKYELQPTIDVDVAYAFKGRSYLRSLGVLVKSFLRAEWERLRLRKAVLTGKFSDPFDTYALFDKLHEEFNLAPIFFFLAGKYGKYDRNMSPKHPLMKVLIRDESKKNPVGIHPSYESFLNKRKVQKELKILESVAGKVIRLSRQHYLKLTLPQSYRILEECGITDDYSMGYAEFPGFRAGTCTPFNFYDLLNEKETGLKIHPFALMDGMFNQYMKQTPEQAIEEMQKVISEVKNVNGRLISIWHNESLSEMGDWKGWRIIYRRFLEIASK